MFQPQNGGLRVFPRVLEHSRRLLELPRLLQRQRRPNLRAKGGASRQAGSECTSDDQSAVVKQARGVAFGDESGFSATALDRARRIQLHHVQFVVAGVVDTVPFIAPAENTAWVAFSKKPNTWTSVNRFTMAGLDLRFTDPNGDDWDLEVEVKEWTE